MMVDNMDKLKQVEYLEKIRNPAQFNGENMMKFYGGVPYKK